MIYNGNLVSLFIMHNSQWILIGGAKITKFNFSNQAVEVNNCSNTPWQELLNKAGARKITISLSGSFSNSIAEQKIQNIAFSGELAEYKISFANLDNIIGKFQINYYERSGIVNEEENYSLGITSSGIISLTNSTK